MTLHTNFLRDNRLKHKLTQARLGEMVGVTRQTIISIEEGKTSPNVRIAIRLAKTLGVSVENLFFGE